MKEAPDSSETSVLTRATRRNNPEDTILHSHRRENLKSYNMALVDTLETGLCEFPVNIMAVADTLEPGLYEFPMENMASLTLSIARIVLFSSVTIIATQLQR
jgi:hypothetical protein